MEVLRRESTSAPSLGQPYANSSYLHTHRTHTWTDPSKKLNLEEGVNELGSRGALASTALSLIIST